MRPHLAAAATLGCALVAGLPACVQPEWELDGLACDDAGRCASGYTCVEGRCVAAGQDAGLQHSDAAPADAPGSDHGPADSGRRDTGSTDGSAPDALAADAAPGDASVPDVSLADAHVPDVLAADAPAADASAGDLAVRDATSLDTLARDHGGGDLAAPDGPHADAFVPDVAVQDGAGPDVRPTDSALPDLTPADHTALDQQEGDAQPEDALASDGPLPACPVEMVRVNGLRVCIDRYEASRGSGDVAESVADQDPWAGISNDGASQACARAGKRLCAASEWATACGGVGSTEFPYGDTYEPLTCNGSDNGEAALPTGSMEGCEGGESGLFDMSGNVWEWTATCGMGFCRIYGGSYLNGGSMLDCGAWASDLAGYTHASVGFRCCRDL